MKDPLGVSPSKGKNQGTTRGKAGKIILTSFDLGSNPGGCGFDFPPRTKEFFLTSCGSLIPFTRANAQWVFHGFHIALQFTLQS